MTAPRDTAAMATAAAIVERQAADFYMVWTKTGHRPRRVHGLKETAEAEAERLAAETPGKKFIVLHAYTKMVAPTPSVAA